MTDYPQRGDGQTLREALAAHTVADPDALAGAGGLASPRRKHDPIVALRRALEGPSLSRMVDRLTPGQRAGERLIVVPTECEPDFARALRAVGFGIQPG